MAEEGAYELEPEEPTKGGGGRDAAGDRAAGGPAGSDAAGNAGGSSMGSARSGRPGAIAPGAKIEAGGLLDDFDEDADFSDPGPNAATVGVAGGSPGIGGSGSGGRGVPDASTLLPPMVTDASLMPVVGSPKILGVIGGVLLLAAVVVTAVTTTSTRALIPPLITLYEGIVHTGTGVVAVLIAARFAERRVNRLELVAARMLVVTALFLAIKNLRIPIPGRVEEFLLAAGVYYLGVLVLFRLPRFETGLIGGAHFCLWVLMELGRIMYGVVEAAGIRQAG